MVLILGMMAIGMVVGFLLRRYQGFVRISGRLVSITVYILLFTLGVSIGANPDILRSLPQLGLQSFVLTLGAVLGSAVLAWLFAKYVLRIPPRAPNAR